MMDADKLDELERQHKAVWDVIRANAEAIAENSEDDWGDLCAVAADMTDDCDPNLARKAIVDAVAAINALPELVAMLRGYQQALDPNETKAAYIGEVKNEDGSLVSWTATKETMAMISARATKIAARAALQTKGPTT